MKKSFILGLFLMCVVSCGGKNFSPWVGEWGVMTEEGSKQVFVTIVPRFDDNGEVMLAPQGGEEMLFVNLKDEEEWCRLASPSKTESKLYCFEEQQLILRLIDDKISVTLDDGSTYEFEKVTEPKFQN